ncbi:MAG: c-type cytochrome domain-containing protein [Fimbriimonadaceae bacterium]
MFRGILILCVFGALLSANAGPTVEYSKHVRPSFKTYCFSCHGGRETKGSVDLTKYKTNADIKKDKKNIAYVIKEIERKTMPPAGSTPLPSDVRKEAC